MRLSHYLFFTTKQTSADAELVSHQLMLKAGLIKPVASGLYSFLPMGYRVLNKIISIVEEEMDRTGAQQLLLPFVQPAGLWKESGRWEEYGEELLRFQDRKGSWFVLSPTHEELVTKLAGEILNSYKKLPVVVYQIQIKFRDELRPRGGTIRAREFLMKDAYSFCQDEAQMRKVYEEMQAAYERIFSRCGLSYKLVEAESGPIGGDVSHEFIAIASSGEDRIVECEQCGYSAKLERAGSEIKIGENETRSISSGEKCPVCRASLRITKGIEIGHLFQLGEHYSEALEASFLDQEGRLHPLLMGCYGIGISRLPAAIIEQNNDRDGIIWPKEVAPFSAVIISTNEQVFDFSEKIYLELKESSMDILWDDRAISAGIKFKDSDLIGIPLKVIIGNAFLREEKIEIKKRSTGEVVKVGKAQFLQKLRELI